MIDKKNYKKSPKKRSVVWGFPKIPNISILLHHSQNITCAKVKMINVAVHCGSIRQTASILTMSEECLRTGDKAVVHFRFIKHPEYLKAGQRMVFREGRTKAVGNVLRIIPPANNQGGQTTRVKPNKMLGTSQLPHQVRRYSSCYVMGCRYYVMGWLFSEVKTINFKKKMLRDIWYGRSFLISIKEIHIYKVHQ